MKLLLSIATGLAVFAAVLATWRLGVYVDSLMTVRTPFYWEFHGWASLVMAAIAGCAVSFFELERP